MKFKVNILRFDKWLDYSAYFPKYLRLPNTYKLFKNLKKGASKVKKQTFPTNLNCFLKCGKVFYLLEILI